MGKFIFNSPLLIDANPPLMADFARLAQELHDQLIAAGMVATADSGQLDFTALAGMTLTTSANYGYRVYKLEDGNVLPVYLKLRFLSIFSISSGRIPLTVRVSIGIATNGAGTLIGASDEHTLGAGTDVFQNADITKLGKDLTTLICCKEGFLGVSWKQLAVAGHGSHSPTTADAINLGNFFICRDTDDRGEVTNTGVSLVAIAPEGHSYAGFGGAPAVTHISASGTSRQTRRSCFATGLDTLTTLDGRVVMFNPYTLTPEPRRIAQLLIVAKPLGSIANDEFDAASVGLKVRHFMAMYSCWPADIFTGAGSRAALAMLWED